MGTKSRASDGETLPPPGKAVATAAALPAHALGQRWMAPSTISAVALSKEILRNKRYPVTAGHLSEFGRNGPVAEAGVGRLAHCHMPSLASPDPRQEVK